MMFNGMPAAELRMWITELERIYLAGVLSTSSVNGVSMSFASRADLEERIATARRALGRVVGGASRAPLIDVLVFRTRRG